MSFNSFSLLVFLFFCVSCGVKGDPVAPSGSYLPSVLDNYEDIQTAKPANEEKKE